MNIIPVLHWVFSQQKVVEAARTVYGLGYNVFVVTKASGSAAQVGVPEAQKLAMKLGKGFFYLPDLPDAVEVFEPSLVILLVPPKYAEATLDPDEIKNAHGKVMVVVGGAEPGLSKRELELGKAVTIEGFQDDVGSIGTLAIALYMIRRS